MHRDDMTSVRCWLHDSPTHNTRVHLTTTLPASPLHHCRDWSYCHTRQYSWSHPAGRPLLQR
eukprot:m.202031 g.202031  ORF g.202031 m.202031 type:complete len:62 (-) comp15510_c1_seq3:2329-2514(-)